MTFHPEIGQNINQSKINLKFSGLNSLAAKTRLKVADHVIIVCYISYKIAGINL